jgi:hypothetical protein
VLFPDDVKGLVSCSLFLAAGNVLRCSGPAAKARDCSTLARPTARAAQSRCIVYAKIRAFRPRTADQRSCKVRSTHLSNTERPEAFV